MTKEEAKKYIKANPKQYFTRAKKSGYVCPLCQNGEGSNGTGIEEIPNSNGRFKCFKCDESGDVLHFIGKEYGLTSFPDILEQAYGIYDLTVEDKKYERRLAVSKEKTIKEKEAKKESIEETKEQDYAEFFKEANKNLNENYAQNNNANYLTKRGISIETQNRFNIGYVADWVSPTAKRAGKNPPSSPRVIIPTSNSSYMARHTDPNVKDYKAVKEGKSRLFNIGALSEESNDPIFIVEGEIDALSVIEVGGQAIGLGGVSNINLLINELEKERDVARQRTFIICLDNDKSGQETAEKMEDEFKKKGYAYMNVSKELMGEWKDPNKALVEDKDSFKTAIENIKATGLKMREEEEDNYSQEYKDKISGVIQGFYIKKPTIETGLKSLDTFLGGGLHAGLYVLAAASGAGKTTLALQLADNIVKSKQDVLFFSGEMSMPEMVAKSLSRLSKETSRNNCKDALTMRIILNVASANNSDYKERLSDLATADFCNNIVEHMRIIDGQPEIAKIKDHIMLHKKITRNTPVVFIDYLQIVKSKEGSSSDRRLQIDEIVSELRILSVQYQTPIFVISSLNRAAYKNDKTKTTGQSNEDEKTIYMADLKESGGIEYGADAILTLYADKEDEEKNGARDMKLRIIKNRTGKRHRKNEHIKLKFHAMFNYFEDCGKSDGETATEDQKETNKKNKKKGKENQKGYIMP